MKTFKDLKFKNHPSGRGLQAIEIFPNGYGVSVVRFRMFGSPADRAIMDLCRVLKGSPISEYASYTSNESEWEVAIIKGTKEDWSLTYSTPITDDVLGHLSDEDVTKVMKQVQEL